MSKFLKIFVALAAMSALAAPAFAVTADMTGFLQIRGIATDNLDGDDDLDDNGRGVDQRFRLWTNAALNENVKAVFGIEVDNIWGDSDAGNPNKEVGSMGADAKGQIEIKHIYLDFNIPQLSTNVKAGTQNFILGGGFIIADDAAGLLARYTPVEGQSVFFAWVKPQEGDQYDDNADSDYYHLQYDATFGGWKVSPYLGYYDINDTTAMGLVGEENKAYFLGADVAGNIGPVALAATLVGNDWEAGAEDGNGYAVKVKATYKLNATTFNAEVARYGDSDNPDGQFFNLSQGANTGAYNNFAEIVTGGRFDSRAVGSVVSPQLASGHRTNPAAAGYPRAADAPYYQNYQYVKLGAGHKINDKNSVEVAYIYAEEAEDTTAGDAITFGHEVDAYYDYAIVPGLTFTAGGGYLLADDDFGDGDDAWKLGTAVTYKF